MQSWFIRSGFWSGTPSRGTAVGFRPVRDFVVPRQRCTGATAARGRSRPSSCSRGPGVDDLLSGSDSRPVDWPRSVYEVSGSTPTKIDLTPSRPRSDVGNAGCSSFSAGAVEALADWGWERAAERAVPRRNAPGRGPAGLRTRRGDAAGLGMGAAALAMGAAAEGENRVRPHECLSLQPHWLSHAAWIRHPLNRPIQWRHHTEHSASTFLGHVQVNHRRLHIPVPQ